jgi:hypothetical protein
MCITYNHTHTYTTRTIITKKNKPIKNMTKSQRSKSIQNGQDVLKAIVLADSFSKEFRPVTLQKPRVSTHHSIPSFEKY